jgi:hypothetical protein
MLRLHGVGGRRIKQIPQCRKKNPSLLIKESNKMHTELVTETKNGE